MTFETNLVGGKRYLFKSGCAEPYKYSSIGDSESRRFFIPEILKNQTIKTELKHHKEIEYLAPDSVQGVTRHIKSPPFPYGFLSCTLSPKEVLDPWAGVPGDGDCLDAFYVGGARLQQGLPICVRPVACWMCIDDGDADWKIAVTDALVDEDPRNVGSLPDEATKEAIEDWLMTYKPTPLQIIRYRTDPDFIERVMDYHVTAHRSAGP